MRALLAALALTLGGAALADPMFEGDWANSDPAACVTGMDFGADNVALSIRDGVIYGYENACTLTNPEPVRGMGAVAYDLACSGEGDRWESRALLMIDDAGQLLYVSDGFVRLYPRCTGYRSVPPLK